MPPAVWQEAVVAGQERGHEEVGQILQAEDQGVVTQVELDQSRLRRATLIRSRHALGSGESQVITLAERVGHAIVDEGRASRVAESLGIQVASTLFLPVLAVQEGVDAGEAQAELRKLSVVVAPRADVLLAIEQRLKEIVNED